ncbi:MAG: peptidylprolyl isomerase [Candidatus Micrarchaeota archaeon]
MKLEVVVFETSMGNIHVELRRKRAPLTVENFLDGAQTGRQKPFTPFGSIFCRLT